jgi:hypothetical protein
MYIIKQLEEIRPSQKKDATLEKITIKLENRDAGKETKYFNL